MIFSTKMKNQNINLTHLNNSIIDIYVEPSDLREEEDIKMNLNFTWNVTEYFLDYMKF